jgi:hypothetical protein
MRLLLVACLLILGWYGLYSLSKELSSRSLTVTTLRDIAALSKRPVPHPASSAPADFSGSTRQQPTPVSTEASESIASESMPQGQDAAPKLAMTRASDIGSFWVEVLLPARLHRGPSVDTPIIGIETVGTTLRVFHARRGWFEVKELKTGDSGWIYGKYLGAVGDPTKVQVASKNLSIKEPVPAEVASVRDRAPAKRVADAKQKNHSVRYRAVAEASARASEAKVDRRTHHDQMASLLERAFSGY